MQALVIAAHGSHLNPNASSPAHSHAQRIRDLDIFDAVTATFWKEEPHFREVLRTINADDIYVVPLFISEGYFTETVIPRELRLEGWSPSSWESDGVSAEYSTHIAMDTHDTVHYCGPVGTHDMMTEVIVQRVESILDDPTAGDGVGVAVVGHGTERNENSAKAITFHTNRLRSQNRFSEVQALFMDEEPDVAELTEFFTTPHIVVVPLFIADGYHTQEDIPVDIGLTSDYRTGWNIPTAVNGHQVWYTGAVGTEPRMAKVIIERAVDAGATVDADIVDGLTVTPAGSHSG